MRGARTTALVWGLVACVLLGAVLLLSVLSPTVRADFGSPVMVGVLVGGVTCLLIAAVVVATRFAVGARWAVAVLVAVAAGGVAVVGVTRVAVSGSAGVGLLLVFAAVAMGAVAAQIPRSGSGRGGQRRKGTG